MPFSNFNIMNILMSLPAVFLAFSFHEFAHAYVAYKMGSTLKYRAALPLIHGSCRLDRSYHVYCLWVWLGKASTS